MFEPSKKQRKLDFKPAQKRKSGSNTPVPNAVPSGAPSAANMRQIIKPAEPPVQPKLQDVRNSQFGPRVLVVKNLKPSRERDMKAYYAKTQEELDESVVAILKGEKPKTPLEKLYRDVEDLVRDGRGETVMDRLGQRMEERLDTWTRHNGNYGEQEFLREVVEQWGRWLMMTTQLRSIFSFLDQAYLLNTNPPERLLERCIEVFQRMILSGPNTTKHLYPDINSLIDRDRRSSDMSEGDSNILSQAIQMLKATKLYQSGWESTFLECSTAYFKECASQPMDLDKYIANVTELITEEVERSDKHGFDSTTRLSLQKLARTALVEKRKRILFHEGLLGEVMKRGDIDTMKSLYELLKASAIQDRLKEPWKAFIQTRGTEICATTHNAERLVQAVLAFKVLCDKFLVEAFDGNAGFKKAMRDGFANFINARHTEHPWGKGGDKVGELLAKYTDLLLRGGLNAVPEELVRQPEGSEADLEASKEAEFDRQIDIVLELFRYIDVRDSFEAFYKLFLAKRLLNGRSISLDAEKAVISKLEKGSGEDYVKELVTMFKDMDVSIAENTKYNEEVWKGRPKRLDLQVQMLTSSAWPAYPEIKVNLPHIVAKEIERYDDWYGKGHSGRKVTWQHSLSTADVRAFFPNGKKHLILSGFQATVLVLFNDIPDSESLSYTKIQQCTNLPAAELERALAGLSGGKHKILIKDPRANGIASTDTFRVNLDFSAPTNRVKIPQLAPKDTRLDEVSAMARTASVDREYEIAAAILRGLKALGKERASMGQIVDMVNMDLVARRRARVTRQEVEIEANKLVKRDFIEVEGGGYVYVP